tara:strand:+ start:75013 stop:75198 length:186 start_codon:yes stop_codon:yes gene_type:complete
MDKKSKLKNFINILGKGFANYLIEALRFSEITLLTIIFYSIVGIYPKLIHINAAFTSSYQV